MNNRFMGQPVSEYAEAHGYVDYAALASCFPTVLNNTVFSRFPEEFECINGPEIEDDDYPEIMQWYIIDSHGADILTSRTEEYVYYAESMHIYLWGITHYGTDWRYVLTDIPLTEGSK